MDILERKSISFIRVLATVSILCCHILPIFENAILKMSAQFFNVGVDIFLILSGYLYGKRKISEKTTYKNWLAKRGKRILVPLYLFLLILFGIDLIKGIRVNIINWLVYILNLQAIEIYLNGAEHLWYLTLAMFCYFITILLDIYRDKFNKKSIVILIITISVIQLFTSYFVYKQLGIYLLYIELYIVSYFVGMYWKYDKVNIRYCIVSSIILFIAIALRLIGRIFFDDSTFYNIIIVGYTQSFIGFSSFFICLYIISNIGEKLNFKIINYLDSISYEIYIVHYMFIVGPVSLVNMTEYSFINCIIIILSSFLLANILHIFSDNIISALSNYKHEEIKNCNT